MPYPDMTAQDVADYFLGTLDVESGDDITQLKLQKLLYYAQGLHVAMHDAPLFPEPIHAWDNGPVVRPIWERYTDYGKRPIDPLVGFDPSIYPPETQELLAAVYATYGQFSAGKLWQMTHQELPWRQTPRNNEITLPVLRQHFTQVVEAGKTGQAVPGSPVWPTNSFRFQGRRQLSERFAPRRAALREIAAKAPKSDPWADEES
jgi:uncharacterized phage-associated protein